MWIQIHNLWIFMRFKGDNLKCLKINDCDSYLFMLKADYLQWREDGNHACGSLQPLFSLLILRLKMSLLFHISSPTSEKWDLFPFPGLTTLVLPLMPSLFQTSLNYPPPLLAKGPFPLAHKTRTLFLFQRWSSSSSFLMRKDPHHPPSWWGKILFIILLDEERSSSSSFLMRMRTTTVTVSIYWNPRARHYTATYRTRLPFDFLYNSMRKVLKRYLHLLECHSLLPYQTCKKSSSHQSQTSYLIYFSPLQIDSLAQMKNCLRIMTDSTFPNALAIFHLNLSEARDVLPFPSQNSFLTCH